MHPKLETICYPDVPYPDAGWEGGPGEGDALAAQRAITAEGVRRAAWNTLVYRDIGLSRPGNTWLVAHLHELARLLLRDADRIESGEEPLE